jgi:prepilin-type N-terminal cleavage/methylation domain-containing protein
MSIARKQQGFSLIEMAIVLVIIGLLMGGILKGQSLIESSRVKSTLQDVDAIISAYHAYYDRFRQLPGDDGALTALQARGGAWASVPSAGNLNGLLDVTAAQAMTGDGENATFFQHLRAAGFLGGNPTDAGLAALPRHALGGVMGVTANAVTGMAANGKYVCLGSVSGTAARSIDTLRDDGVPNAGSVRATTGTANTAPSSAATVYVDSDSYTVCVQF